MTLRMISSLSTVALLAACGGGETGGNDTSFGSITQTSGQSFGVSAPTNDTRRVLGRLANGLTQVVTTSAEASLDQAVFEGFDSPGYMLFEAQGTSGTVSVFANVNNTSSGFAPGARADSFGGTTPGGGTAKYTGEYVGFLTRDETTSVPLLTESFIVGEVSIDADFAAGTVSGDITQRNRFITANGNGAGTMADVSLGVHSIANGASVVGGTTVGGGLDNPVYVPDGPITGEWNIAFGGDGATEAGGTVLIDHDLINGVGTADDYIETGGFAVAKN